MAAKSFVFPLGPEDRWLIASVSTLAKLVEPVGPLAAGKRRWLAETRRLLKEASEFLTQKLPVGVVEYDELAAVTGPIEDTLLDLGAKLAGPEIESEAERERNQREAESGEAETNEEADKEDAEEVEPAADAAAEEVDEPAAEEWEPDAEEWEPDAEEWEPAAEAWEPAAEEVVTASDAVVPVVVPPGDEQEQVRCFYCEEGHPLCKCPAIRKQEGKQRRATIIGLRVCFNCFSKKHRVLFCPVLVGRCLKCPKLHHTLLHGLV